MKSKEEMQSELQKLNYEKVILEGKINRVISDKKKLLDFAVDCATFDEEVIFYIGCLMSYIEQKAYTSFIYKKTITEDIDSNHNNMEETCVGIADEESLNIFIYKKENDLSRLFETKQAYELLVKERKILADDEKTRESYIGSYESSESNYKKYASTITFGFLLSESKINATKVVNYSRYNFYDKPYVQNFIRYLYELQIQKDGAKLTPNEIYEAYMSYTNTLLEQEKQKDPKKI